MRKPRRTEKPCSRKCLRVPEFMRILCGFLILLSWARMLIKWSSMIALRIQSANSYGLRAGVQVPLHRHALAQWEVVVEGTYVLVEPGREQVLQPGSWAWLAPQVPHGWRSQTAVRCLTFKYAAAKRMPQRTTPLVTHASSADAWLTSLPERVLQTWATGRDGMRLVASQLLSAALGLSEQEREREMGSGLNEKWRALIADLHRPTMPSLSLEAMAKRVHLSPSHFRRQFKTVFGKPPVQYQFAQKMEWARSILRHTSIPLKEVVDQLGYSDLSAFSKAFAKHFRQRPREARRGWIPPQS